MSGSAALADDANGMEAAILAPRWNRLVMRPLRPATTQRVGVTAGAAARACPEVLEVETTMNLPMPFVPACSFRASLRGSARALALLLALHAAAFADLPLWNGLGFAGISAHGDDGDGGDGDGGGDGGGGGGAGGGDGGGGGGEAAADYEPLEDTVADRRRDLHRRRAAAARPEPGGLEPRHRPRPAGDRARAERASSA